VTAGGEGRNVMAEYMPDAEVAQVLALARGTAGLAVFVETLAAAARLARAVEPLAVEVQRLRALVGAQQQDQARAARMLQAKDAEIHRLHGEVDALEDRLATIHAA
jgi:hypothetical protein